jgi:hypothetical protein
MGSAKRNGANHRKTLKGAPETRSPRIGQQRVR